MSCQKAVGAIGATRDPAEPLWTFMVAPMVEVEGDSRSDQPTSSPRWHAPRRQRRSSPAALTCPCASAPTSRAQASFAPEVPSPVSSGMNEAPGLAPRSCSIAARAADVDAAEHGSKAAVVPALHSQFPGAPRTPLIRAGDGPALSTNERFLHARK
jgi:hypothetical protein